MLRELKRAHEVTYLTLDDGQAGGDARERAGEYCHELITVPHRTRAKFTPGFYLDLSHNLVSRLPYFIQKYKSAMMRREVARLAGGGRFDVLVCDFLMSSINVPARVNCPAVLFQHNVEAMIWKRHYEVQQNPLKKAYLYGQWRKAFAYERAACRRFDSVITVSADDSARTREDYGVEAVADVATGVDTEYFRPRGGAEKDPFNLVFTGSMDWLPNEDAIRYFTEQVMPLVKQAIPQATLTVVGRNPYPSLLELSRRDPSIVVTGRVEDVRPYMERAAGYVVPLRIGGGTRLKIYEAMAMEQPVVSTRVGAEGLPVEDREHLLLADAPEDFAAAVVRVLTDENLARSLGARAAKLVREQFGWARVAEDFAGLCAGAAARSKEQGRAGAQVEEELRQVV
jgi:glycosyltransferase involved in cell wall biosynthesis